jgi:hypothetical protein
MVFSNPFNHVMAATRSSQAKQCVAVHADRQGDPLERQRHGTACGDASLRRDRQTAINFQTASGRTKTALSVGTKSVVRRAGNIEGNFLRVDLVGMGNDRQPMSEIRGRPATPAARELASSGSAQPRLAAKSYAPVAISLKNRRPGHFSQFLATKMGTSPPVDVLKKCSENSSKSIGTS